MARHKRVARVGAAVSRYALMVPVIVVLGMGVVTAQHGPTAVSTAGSKAAHTINLAALASGTGMQTVGSNIRVDAINCGIRMYGECSLTYGPRSPGTPLRPPGTGCASAPQVCLDPARRQARMHLTQRVSC